MPESCKSSPQIGTVLISERGSVSRSYVKYQRVIVKASDFSLPRPCGSQTRAPFSNQDTTRKSSPLKTMPPLNLAERVMQ
jgi:hypothetical protein